MGRVPAPALLAPPATSAQSAGVSAGGAVPAYSAASAHTHQTAALVRRRQEHYAGTDRAPDPGGTDVTCS